MVNHKLRIALQATRIGIRNKDCSAASFAKVTFAPSSVSTNTWMLCRRMFDDANQQLQMQVAAPIAGARREGTLIEPAFDVPLLSPRDD